MLSYPGRLLILTHTASQSEHCEARQQNMEHMLTPLLVVAELDAKLEVATMERTIAEEKRIV